MGDRPAERFGSGRSLAAYAGVAPVTWTSGQTVRVAFRRASSVHLRSILHAVAFSMISHSPRRPRLLHPAPLPRRRPRHSAEEAGTQDRPEPLPLHDLRPALRRRHHLRLRPRHSRRPHPPPARTARRSADRTGPRHARHPRSHRHRDGTPPRREHPDDLPTCPPPPLEPMTLAGAPAPGQSGRGGRAVVRPKLSPGPGAPTWECRPQTPPASLDTTPKPGLHTRRAGLRASLCSA
ncbi:transposase [Streptomyces olivaceus]|uniref:transposase n=1 Tax=Streptomyces olivaceus TaxID=47716 RepID=UPI0036B7B135